MVETHFPKGSLFWFLTKYNRINAHLICFPGSAKKEMCWYLVLQRMRKDYCWRSMGCQVQHTMYMCIRINLILSMVSEYLPPKYLLYKAFKTKYVSFFPVIFSSELI